MQQFDRSCRSTNSLFLGLLKLLQELPQSAVLEALTVSCRCSDRDHVIRVFYRRENVVHEDVTVGQVQIVGLISPKPSSSWTLILCTWRLVDMNSSFLSAFKLLALNDGPDMEEETL